MKAGQESSYDKVSIFVILNVREVFECLPFHRSVGHPRNSYLRSHKSTVSEVTVITVFDTVSFGLIDLIAIGNDSHQFCRFWSEV